MAVPDSHKFYFVKNKCQNYASPQADVSALETSPVASQAALDIGTYSFEFFNLRPVAKYLQITFQYQTNSKKLNKIKKP